MANEEHLKIIKQGVVVWNQWRTENPKVIPDLSGIDLFTKTRSGANLREVNFSGAYLDEATLPWADLSMANLRESSICEANLCAANLNKADLCKATLILTDCNGANFSGANLKGAWLRETKFNKAELNEADFSRALLDETVFSNTSLKAVKGLDKCHHTGPSSIDYRTLQQSRPLPMKFLRGCGLPDDLVELMVSKPKNPRYCSCFISFSYADKEFVDSLYNDLQSHGIRCWYAAHDMQPGKKIHEQIEEAIKTNDRVLLILSNNSMNSEWVKTEIANARAREVKEGRSILFPISLVEFKELKKWECFDADIGKDSAREIREYFIPNWHNPSEYKRGFKRLIQALQISQPKP